jgi:phosphate-selective porin OprO/OprP
MRTTTFLLVLLGASPAMAEELANSVPNATTTPATFSAQEEAEAENHLQLATLENRLYALEQRARNAEARADLAEKKEAPPTSPGPVVGVDGKGFAFTSADGAFALKLKGLVAFDGRKYLGDATAVDGDAFLVRKLRPVFEVTLLKLADVRLNLDFANSAIVVIDAYVDIKPTSWFKVKVGKFVAPVGLERLQNDPELAFVERSLIANLTSVRDVGVQATVDLAGGFVHTDFGVFDGAPDNVNIDLDSNQGKDLAARLWLQPLRLPALAGLGELAFGVSGSTGTRKGQPNAARSNLAPYRTSGQTVLFEYLSSATVAADTVYASGRHERLNPQAFYHWKGLALEAEYSLSRQHVVKGTNAAQLTHHGWNGQIEYIFGGKAALNGAQVTNVWDPARGQYGALELAFRYSELHLDDDAFPVFADPTRSAGKARGVSGAVSWYLSRNLRLSANYEQTFFSASTAGKGLYARQDEKVVLARTQVVF